MPYPLQDALAGKTAQLFGQAAQRRAVGVRVDEVVAIIRDPNLRVDIALA
ncbi:hypothetical protein J2W68_001648 [Luteimonas terrae]|uniref:Uncharacterized protein n=1 Tax=Luteimonas terrae TaxID=1530191 RepID=A0ABU1XW03_9GAMM|nr:hypothetical protein [Luteimonas terrae]MDR7192932.1 hypothetical protein [Luteimonas terrae]